MDTKKGNLEKQLEDIKKEYSSAADIILSDKQEKGSKIVFYSVILSILIFIVLFYFFSPSTRGLIFHRFKKISEMNYEKPKPLVLNIDIHKKKENSVQNMMENSPQNKLNESSKKISSSINKKIVIPKWRKPKLKKIKRVKRKLTDVDLALEILKELKPKLAPIVNGRDSDYKYKGATILKKESNFVVIDLKIVIVSSGVEKHLIWKVNTKDKKALPIGFETANFELSGNL